MTLRYAELQVTTNFSFLRGASHAEDLVEQAKELGLSAIAVTDRNSLAGVVRAHVAAKADEKGPGLRLVIGVRLDLEDAPGLLVYPRDRAAYGRLCRLLSEGQLRADKGKCILYLADVAAHAEGQIFIALPPDDWNWREAGANAGPQGKAKTRSAQILPFVRERLDSSAPLPLTGRGRGWGEASDHSVPPPLTPPREGEGNSIISSPRSLRGEGQGDQKIVIPDAGQPEIPTDQLEKNFSPAIRDPESRLEHVAPGSRLFTITPSRDGSGRDDKSAKSGERETLEAPAQRPPLTLTLSPCQVQGHGEREKFGITSPITTGESERLDAALSRVKAAVGNAPLYLAASHTYRGDDRARIAALALLGERCGTPIVATNNVLYHHPDCRELQDVVTCIREKTTLREAGLRLEANAERHIKSPEEMARLFKDYEAALERTIDIVEACRFSLGELKYEYPDEPVPPGATPQEHLADLTWKGAQGHFPEGVPEKVRETIEKELKLIGELKFAPYFLTVHDIVAFARSKEILCQGRGSAANSVVCYCLGITAVNPVEVNLLFERFISSARLEPPDIDVDFEHERREEVIQWIYERYGRHRAGLTATVISYRSRSAVRDVGKVFGLSDDTISALAGMVWGTHAGGVPPDKHVRGAGLDPTDRTLAKVMELAQQLMGFPRHLSQHVGGFVLTRGPLVEVVPVGNAAMADRTFIEWDKDDIAALGLMKVDVLALGMLTCIRKAFDLIEKHHGEKITLATVPRDDKPTYDMLCRADSLGVFQVESRAQMNMLPRLKPRIFYDLVIEVAIVRPGPIQGDMVHPYLRRRAGVEEVVYPYPKGGDENELKIILGKTLGVPLFQEQAMRIAMIAAEFDDKEVSDLRRAMATFRRVGTIGLLEEKMISRMVERGYDKDFATRCFSQIKGFGEYGFPESHAASFALLVYVSSWIKCHYPAAFACALLNSQPMGFYAPAQIVRDASEHDVDVRDVDVTFSDWYSTLEDKAEGPPALRLGLHRIDGFKKDEAEAIVAMRNDTSCIHGEERGPWQIRELVNSASIQQKRNVLSGSACAESNSAVVDFVDNIPLIPSSPTSFVSRENSSSKSMEASMERRNAKSTIKPELNGSKPMVIELSASGTETFALGSATPSRQFLDISCEMGPEHFTPTPALPLQGGGREGEWHTFKGEGMEGEEGHAFQDGEKERERRRTFRDGEKGRERRTFQGEGREEEEGHSFQDGEKGRERRTFQGRRREEEGHVFQGGGKEKEEHTFRSGRQEWVEPIFQGEGFRVEGNLQAGTDFQVGESLPARGNLQCGEQLQAGGDTRTEGNLKIEGRASGHNFPPPLRGRWRKAPEGGAIADFAARNGIKIDTLEKLAAADAFRSLGLDRRQALWEVKALANAPPLPLFSWSETRDTGDEIEVRLPEMALSEHVVNDYQTLRLSLKAHPMSFLREDFRKGGVLSCKELGQAKNGAYVRVAGVVLVRQRPGNGNVVFMTVEDETGIANVVIWPKLLERFRKVVMTSRLILIEGRVQKQEETHADIIHVVSSKLIDRSDWLLRLSELASDMSVPLANADEVIHPEPGSAHPSRKDDRRIHPRFSREPKPRHPRNVRVIPKSRDFH